MHFFSEDAAAAYPSMDCFPVPEAASTYGHLAWLEISHFFARNVTSSLTVLPYHAWHTYIMCFTDMRILAAACRVFTTWFVQLDSTLMLEVIHQDNCVYNIIDKIITYPIDRVVGSLTALTWHFVQAVDDEQKALILFGTGDATCTVLHFLISALQDDPSSLPVVTELILFLLSLDNTGHILEALRNIIGDSDSKEFPLETHDLLCFIMSDDPADA
jgi:hypothetical protein